MPPSLIASLSNSSVQILASDCRIGFLVDIQKHILIVDAEMHADEEQFLLEDGSKQQDLWGINLYPTKFGTDEFIEFDSMINIRPRQHNMSRGVENEDIRKRIIALVSEKVG